jgi:hypothetical protein
MFYITIHIEKRMFAALITLLPANEDRFSRTKEVSERQKLFRKGEKRIKANVFHINSPDFVVPIT